MFLAALERDRLAAIASSGALSSFELLAAKEARLCSCTLWPNVLGRLEEWEMLASHAPRPLLQFQGLEDEYFSNQVFNTACRRLGRSYRRLDAVQQLTTRLFPGGHAWTDERRLFIAEQLRRVLGTQGCHRAWPWTRRPSAPATPLGRMPRWTGQTCAPAWRAGP